MPEVQVLMVYSRHMLIGPISPLLHSWGLLEKKPQCLLAFQLLPAVGVALTQLVMFTDLPCGFILMKATTV
jgi:hypothetical protein